MSCNSNKEISIRLRNLAIWANQFNERLHFEWIWDGYKLWIVQMDICKSRNGTNPLKIHYNKKVNINGDNLLVFRLANTDDFNKYRKLRNVLIYKKIGYKMPAFYVLDDNKIIKNILKNQFSSVLLSDLEILTSGSLVIRTDGIDIPEDKREMLPRSEELRTVEDTANYLINKFKPKIIHNNLSDKNLSLIAHLFIPSISSAWARAEPDKRIIRIESIWGIPEGLYWYSHDTYEVDIGSNIEKAIHSSIKIKRRERFKSNYIMPDKNGQWIIQQTVKPYDWNSSIRKDSWIKEIALNSRKIADFEQSPVNIMWFVELDSHTIDQNNLPWYHCPCDLPYPTYAAPRKKLSISDDFQITTLNDWAILKSKINNGVPIERIIIKPEKSELIRDLKFVEKIAKFAATNNIVIELAGGILSHAYYTLIRNDAQVECIDLFGIDEEKIEFDKLVRDNIPSIVQNHGEYVEVVKLTKDALIEALRQKLIEEAFEVIDAKSGEDILQELADVKEIINSILSELNVSNSLIEKIRIDKKKQKGGFEQGYILKQTSKPGSIFVKNLDNLQFILDQEKEIISDPKRIPKKQFYQRPDLRFVNKGLEKLFIFKTPINLISNKITPIKKDVYFSIPIFNHNLNFKLSLEFNREIADLRGKLRLYINTKQSDQDNEQLELDFNEPKK